MFVFVCLQEFKSRQMTVFILARKSLQKKKNGCGLCNATKMLNSFSCLLGVVMQFMLIWSFFFPMNFCFLNHIPVHKKYTTEFLHPVLFITSTYV